jgi:hypothetical protein
VEQLFYSGIPNSVRLQRIDVVLRIPQDKSPVQETGGLPRFCLVLIRKDKESTGTDGALGKGASILQRRGSVGGGEETDRKDEG